MELTRPPALRPGDRVALIAPAGPPDPARAERGAAMLARWDLQPELGAAAFAGSSQGFLAADDRQRLADLHAAWRDPGVAGVLALRGGYGCQRIVDDIDWRLVAANPKVFCGFSDCTVLHLALQRRAAVTSIHGPNLAADPDRLGADAEAWLRTALMSATPLGGLPARGASLVSGVSEGPLLGGNLTLLCTSIGTPEQPELAGALVLLEDVGERPYALDRALLQLRRAGVLADAAGLVFATFHACEETGSERHSSSAAEVVAEHAGAMGVPAVCGLPLGHGAGQLAVPLGTRCRLDAGAGTLTFVEPALR